VVAAEGGDVMPILLGVGAGRSFFLADRTSHYPREEILAHLAIAAEGPVHRLTRR